MNNVIEIKSRLITKLQGITGLNGVYDYEPDTPTNGMYPFASVIFKAGDAQFADTMRNLRTFTYTARVYQERVKAGFGNQKSERVINEICDEVVNAFDMDTTLSGFVKMVKPISVSKEYIDREIGDTRVAEFTIECVTVVNSI